MEDFAKVFIIGLFLFALALVLFGGSSIDTDDGGSDAQEGVIYSADSLGDIGTVASRKRSINLGTFSVGYTLGKDSVAEEESVLIQNGWFKKNSKEIRFSGEDADNAVVEFDIAEMNDYGKLEITLNGKTIYSDTPTPQKFVLLAEDLISENTIIISATSSGARFWAPATYSLKGITVTLDRYSDQAKVIPFEVFPYEYSGWGHGSISFSVDDTAGFDNLIATINSKTIYEGRPLPGDIIEKDFTKTDTTLKVGENILTLRTEKGASYDLENAEMVIYYYGSGEQNTKVVNFDGSYYKSQMDENGNLTGQIRFYVEKVNLDSGLKVYMNSRLYEMAHLKEHEWNTLYFDADDLNTRDNELKFTASGSYQIEQLEVSVVRKDE